MRTKEELLETIKGRDVGSTYVLIEVLVDIRDLLKSIEELKANRGGGGVR